MIKTNRTIPQPVAAGELSYIERLLLHALRQWVHDRSRWPEVVLEFNRACGPRAATRMCESLESAFRTLGLHARRHIRLHPVLCCSVSQDELCLLNIIAAHQSRSAPHAKAMINWLVAPHAGPVLAAETDIVARSLCDTGYILDVRQQTPQHPRPPAQVIHAVH